jgi:hypothetical protein
VLSLEDKTVGSGTSVDAKITYASSSPDVICVLCIFCIRTNTHLNCAAVYYSTTYFKISMWNSCQEQLGMNTEICRL